VITTSIGLENNALYGFILPSFGRFGLLGRIKRRHHPAASGGANERSLTSQPGL
jgi:hypothetical protein